MDKKELLQKLIPDLIIAACEHKSGDEHSVLEVNNQWIFRFAKSDKVGQHMATEVALLKALENKISCAIPRVAYYFPQENCFGYLKIDGTPLSKELYASFNAEQKNQLCHDLAQFIDQLRASLSLFEAHKLGLKNADWPMQPLGLRNRSPRINPELKAIFDGFIERYEQLEGDNLLSTIVHNDLHTDNILVNEKTRILAGIIDFSSTSIGSIYHEFRYLHLIDYHLVADAVAAYNVLAQQKLRANDAYIYCVATEFSRLFEAQEQGNIQKITATTERIRLLYNYL